jgi:hypothetical protein
MSILILAGGLACAWVYLRKPPVPENPALRMLRGDRPWRRVGAAICLLLSVMFVLGVYLVDIPQRPRTYAAFWLVMMLLVVWLCMLAIKDMLYTRKMLAKWREARDSLLRPQDAARPASKESQG